MADLRYAAIGVVGGGVAFFISLVTLLVGLLPVALALTYVGRQAGLHRWAFVGGLMMGIALGALPTLGPAVTNTDPSVGYSSDTIPLLIIALVIGVLGVVTVITGAARGRLRATPGLDGPGL